MACAFLFSLIFHSNREKLQSPIIFMICLMSLYGSIALSQSYCGCILAPLLKKFEVWCIYHGHITMGYDAHLFLSFDSEKDRTLPNLMFMLFFMSLSYFISVHWSFWVYHSSLPGRCVA
jgi:hypothetical protein